MVSEADLANEIRVVQKLCSKDQDDLLMKVFQFPEISPQAIQDDFYLINMELCHGGVGNVVILLRFCA